LSARSAPPHLFPRIVLLILCTSALIAIGSAVTISPGEIQSTVPEIAKGDPVTIQGNTTGQPPNGLMLWIIGNDYAKTFLVPVTGDNTYFTTLKSGDTARLASGQYQVLIQHPGANGRFDIIYKAGDGSVVNLQPAWRQITYPAGPIQLGPEDDNTYNAGTDTVVNLQRDGGTKIFQLTNGSSQAPDAGASLMDTLTAQNVDDTFTSASFVMSNPDVVIHPVADHVTGDRFAIHGTTNLAPGDTLNVEIAPASVMPTLQLQGAESSGSSGRVTVVPGTNVNNCWTYMVDTTGFRPATYTVRVSGILLDGKDSDLFSVVDHLPTTDVTTPTVPTAGSGTLQQTVSTSPTQKSPLLPAVWFWGLAGAFFLSRGGKKH
jgi:trimeric autotransporter adhesin